MPTQISPNYPSLATQQELLHRRREAAVARAFLAVIVASVVMWVYNGGTAPILGTSIGIVGFIATCFYAGGRKSNPANRVK